MTLGGGNPFQTQNSFTEKSQTALQNPASRVGPQRRRPESSHARKPMKKLSRLPIALELEIRDSSYLKFMKKIKMGKEKSKHNLPQASGSQNFAQDEALLLSAGSKFCPLHLKSETVILSKFGIQLVPVNLTCNNFHKGLKQFEFWKDELKNSLMNDLFITPTGN